MIASDVYALASAPSGPLSSLIKEALDMIDSHLDAHRKSNLFLSFNDVLSLFLSSNESNPS